MGSAAARIAAVRDTMPHTPCVDPFSAAGSVCGPQCGAGRGLSPTEGSPTARHAHSPLRSTSDDGDSPRQLVVCNSSPSRHPSRWAERTVAGNHRSSLRLYDGRGTTGRTAYCQPRAVSPSAFAQALSSVWYMCGMEKRQTSLTSREGGGAQQHLEAYGKAAVGVELRLWLVPPVSGQRRGHGGVLFPQARW